MIHTHSTVNNDEKIFPFQWMGRSQRKVILGNKITKRSIPITFPEITYLILDGTSYLMVKKNMMDTVMKYMNIMREGKTTLMKITHTLRKIMDAVLKTWILCRKDWLLCGKM